MGKIKNFEDGSVIEWLDKETLRYKKNKCYIDVWVDWKETGWFSSTRIIKVSLLKNWNCTDNTINKIINDVDKKDIIDKINQYLKKQCLIE
jgi:hypothetical protein